MVSFPQCGRRINFTHKCMALGLRNTDFYYQKGDRRHIKNLSPFMNILWLKQRSFPPLLGSNFCYKSSQLTFVTLPPRGQSTQSIEKKLEDRDKRSLSGSQGFTTRTDIISFRKRRSRHSGLMGGQDRDGSEELIKNKHTGDGSSQIWVHHFCGLSWMNVELHRTQLSLSGRTNENFLEGSGMNHFSQRSKWTAG